MIKFYYKAIVDRLSIEVPQQVQFIFQALGNLRLREKYTSEKVYQYGQEFAFFPTQLFFRTSKRSGVSLCYEESGVRVWMGVDCRKRFHEIEEKREFFLEQSVLNDES